MRQVTKQAPLTEVTTLKSRMSTNFITGTYFIVSRQAYDAAALIPPHLCSK